MSDDTTQESANNLTIPGASGPSHYDSPEREIRNFSAIKALAMTIYIILPYALSLIGVLILGNSIGEAWSVMFNTNTNVTAYSVIMVIGLGVLSIRSGQDTINNADGERHFVPPYAPIALVALSAAQFLLLAQAL